LTYDLMSLFRIKRKLRHAAEITAMPVMRDLLNFPMAMNLLTQATSRFDIRDEDYSTISDIRAYQPMDSIKRIHWKLTAKRNEWLVKIFQSNALNQIFLIVDTKKQGMGYREQCLLEDRVVELALSMAQYSMRRGMPVEFIASEGHRTTGQTLGEFGAIYHAAAEMAFEDEPPLSPFTILDKILSDAPGNINAVILTSELDGALYDKIMTAFSNGHYIAVLYFVPWVKSDTTEKIFDMLAQSGAPCYRLTDDMNIYNDE
jgi:hypothetical protein